MRILASFSLLLFALVLTAPESFATEQMALNSGNSCSYCHLDPAGGGDLTADGDAYLEQLYDTSEGESLGTSGRIFRFAVGYLHILFSVFWFGTILYIHIVLKPAYAAKGLPRGEKFIGIISFWIVGISGLILTLSRISSWSQLFETRFGLLLTIKIALYLLMMISAIFVIKIIGPRLQKKLSVEHVPGEPFTAETLSSFDGQEGRPCYFACQGKVYDASESKLWPEGQHMKRHSAGMDLTQSLALAPHKEEVMSRLKVVGELSTDQKPTSGASVRQFYFIANMNLGIVFIVLFILALWRWG